VSETTETSEAEVRPATQTSILSGVGTIIGGVADGVVDIARSAIDAEEHAIAFAVDLPIMDYHAVAAGVTAFFGDMDDAEAQAAAMKETRADAYGQLRAIGSDIGF
jgi:hypothetical protein